MISRRDLKNDLEHLRHQKERFLKLIRFYPKDKDFKRSLRNVEKLIENTKMKLKNFKLNSIYEAIVRRLEEKYDKERMII